jgi:RHS repeat-associated protein
MTRPNNVATNYSYDNFSHLLSVLHQLSGSTIDGATYTVDSAGNRTAKTDNRANVTSNYGYDAIYQLLQTTQGGTTTESYTYDPVGNRLSSLGVSPYSNNSSNELTSTPSASYTYDNNGNTLTKTDSTGTTTYAWDFENRLASVTLPGNGGTVTFKYDPMGRRIYKSSSSGTSVFAYDGNNIVEETNSSGTVVARYAQGQNIDEPLAMLRSSTASYYESDTLGTITSLSNSSGALAQTYTYDSFGNTTNSSGSLTNFFRYTGREFETETGLYYDRARYLDPTTGKFISEDPLAFNAGLNFYDYVNGDPTNLADPTGLFGWSSVIPAYAHYCGGSGTPWTSPFSSINWGSTQNDVEAKVKGMVGAGCSERTIPVSFNFNAQTAGADRLIIGRHVVKVTGTIQVHCDCTWSFTGDMSSALGYDVYAFPPSNRGIGGETETWIGRNLCKGKPFNIYLPGSTGLSAGGKINGNPTCNCKN